MTCNAHNIYMKLITWNHKNSKREREREKKNKIGMDWNKLLLAPTSMPLSTEEKSSAREYFT